ncbi:MAG: hypothetical protein ABIG61_11885 [Planctomycetota bacterium]
MIFFYGAKIGGRRSGNEFGGVNDVLWGRMDGKLSGGAAEVWVVCSGQLEVCCVGGGEGLQLVGFQSEGQAFERVDGNTFAGELLVVAGEGNGAVEQYVQLLPAVEDAAVIGAGLCEAVVE